MDTRASALPPSASATPDEVRQLQNILAQADEALQVAIAAVNRARLTDERAEAHETLRQARTALNQRLSRRS